MSFAEELSLEVLVPLDMAQMERQPDATTKETHGNSQSKSDGLMVDLRKYLLVMAILAATVTYVAGLNPPGGVWLTSKDGHLTGNQILVVTDHPRYNAFFYSNTVAFMASVVVILLLLLVERSGKKTRPLVLLVLRVVMALDMLALMVAYASGASRGVVTTVFASVLVSSVPIYAAFRIIKYLSSRGQKGTVASGTGSEDNHDQDKELEQPRRVMMLFAIFAATNAYTVGMSPPGGFWPDTQGGYRAGDPVLLEYHSRRFVAFFICNTVAFVASLAAIMLLTTMTSKQKDEGWCHHAPYLSVMVSLLGLFVAYAFGSCRKTGSTVYVFTLVFPVLGFTIIQFLIQKFLREKIKRHLISCWRRISCWTVNEDDPAAPRDSRLKKAHSLVLLLATLAATITYQAGMNPPGGFWPDDRDGHKGGDPILMNTHRQRYRVFFYCNSVALVTSVVVIVMVLSKHVRASVVHKRHALEAAMILDLLSLMAAYAVGCCRDVTTSLHVIALAGAVLVYVVIHIVFFTLEHKVKEEEEEMNKKRKLLLLLAILAATITYQAGLTPPGGFWLEDDEFDHIAGYPILLSNYPRRYRTFFYCNATSFMASIAMILLLVNPNLYTHGINCYALYVCALAGLSGLVGAYVAGSSRHVRTSIIVVALVAVVFVFVILLLIVLKRASSDRRANSQNEDPKRKKTREGDDEDKETYTKGKYLMLVGILVASATYQAGLTPPGGVWPDSINGHAAGDPVLHDSNKHRYRLFFYSNSVSFLASIVVILVLLLGKPLFARTEGVLGMEYKELLRVAQSSIVLALLGLLWAYASGCSREWETSGYVGALGIAVLLYIAIHVVVSCRDKKGEDSHKTPQGNSESSAKQCTCKCSCKAGEETLEGTKVGDTNV